MGLLNLRRPEIADIVVEAIRAGERVFHRYQLHSFVVMPNHVHLLASPRVPLPILTRTIKSYTAKQANQLLGRTETNFGKRKAMTISFETNRNLSAFAAVSRTIPYRRAWLQERKNIAGRAHFRGDAGPEARRGAGAPPYLVSGFCARRNAGPRGWTNAPRCSGLATGATDSSLQDVGIGNVEIEGGDECKRWPARCYAVEQKLPTRKCCGLATGTEKGDSPPCPRFQRPATALVTLPPLRPHGTNCAPTDRSPHDGIPFRNPAASAPRIPRA